MAEKITAAEAAKRLGVNLRTLWRWREAGKIRDAGKAGRTVLFYARDVDALMRERKGAPTVPTLTLEDVYVRLTTAANARSWEDVEALRHDVAATICATAEDKGPILRAWKAATSMAATHPDERLREEWRRTAGEYGEWLGMRAEETEAAIGRKGRDGTYATYESAKAQAEAAPRDIVLEYYDNYKRAKRKGANVR